MVILGPKLIFTGFSGNFGLGSIVALNIREELTIQRKMARNAENLGYLVHKMDRNG